MGEIGIDRNEYLYELTFCEIVLIERGYSNRHRNLWSATRWQTFYFMSVMADLKKDGIHSPKDLIKFPWDREHTQDITPEEVDDMIEEMKTINAERLFGK